jgi:hypothetical protein
MPINVPQSVFDKYFDVIDSTFAIFGVTCQLVFTEMEKIDYDSDNNIPDRNSINIHHGGGGHIDRGEESYREVEKLEDIILKVYWDSKSWIKVGGNVVVPDGSIQTIGKMTDLPQVLRAKELIVHKDIKNYGEIRFERSGAHYPMGLQQTKYFACFWGRIQ